MLRSTENSGPRRVVAVFDFDGTITQVDTFRDIFLWRFGLFRLTIGMLITLPLIILYAFGVLVNDIPKTALFRRFFRGWAVAEYQSICSYYAVSRLPGLVRPGALERIKWHKDQGHLLVICSASLADWIEPWAASVGFDHVIATRAHISNGILTGKFEGPCAYGARKVVGLMQLGIDESNCEIYAYGDSKGDRELLSIAQHSVFRPFHSRGN